MFKGLLVVKKLQEVSLAGCTKHNFIERLIVA
jgi:hypothetical protein